MVKPSSGKKYIESCGLSPLRREFTQDATIDMARPIEAIAKIERVVIQGGNALVADGDEPQIRGDGWWMAKSLACPPIVGHSFQAVEEVEFSKPNGTNQNDHCGCNENGCLMDWPEFHRGELNKKPRAIQGCSGLV